LIQIVLLLILYRQRVRDARAIPQAPPSRT